MKEQLSTMIQAAIDGEVSCCEVHTQLKEIETLIKSGLKVIQDGCVNEAREFVKGERYYGGVWQVKSTPTFLDYSKDTLYVSLSADLSQHKKLLNDAWKAKNEGHGFFNELTGEQIQVLPVKTPGHEIAVFKATQPKEKENDGKTGLAF